MKKWIKILLDLNKVRITFAVTLTTVAGYILAKGSIDQGMILPVLGIFILACGSAVINHVQDRDKDAIMPRTSKRPIPSGDVSASLALVIGISEIIIGSLLIYL